MWHDIRQNTDEWLELRSGKLTGSSFAKVMANYGKAFGDPAKKLAVDIAIEQICGLQDKDCYTNAHMDRGHEEEPIARMLYEEKYFCEVTNGGFYDNGFTGCSPDGLVGNDGVIEIKSAIPSIHYARICRNSYDPQYKWQLVSNLMESGRDWIDFISFCSWFPKDKRLFVYKSTKEDFAKEIEMVNTRVAEFKKLVDETKNTISTFQQ